MYKKSLLLLLTGASLAVVASNFSKPYYMFSEIEFSEEEKAQHIQAIPAIEDGVENCLKREITEHQKFYKKYGFSRYYGDQSEFAKAKSRGDREAMISMVRSAALSSKNVRYPQGTDFAPFIDPENEIMRPTSCIGLTLVCFKEAFSNESEESADIWEKIRVFVKANDQTGTSLQYALKKLGWKIAYFNSDPSLNEERDHREREILKYSAGQHGDHAAHYNEVMRRDKYFDFHVDDKTTLVGFGEEAPDSFKNVGLFVGVAHKGYHVFPGYDGFVVEGHSARPLSDARTIEAQHFNPSKQTGAPYGEFHSGSIAIPPTYYVDGQIIQPEVKRNIFGQKVSPGKKKRKKLFGIF